MINTLRILFLQVAQKGFIFLVSLFLLRKGEQILFEEFALVRSISGMYDAILISPVVTTFYLSKESKLSPNIVSLLLALIVLVFLIYFEYIMVPFSIIMIVSLLFASLGNAVIIKSKNLIKTSITVLFLSVSPLLAWYSDVFSSVHALLLIALILVVNSFFNLADVTIFKLSYKMPNDKELTVITYTVTAMAYTYLFRLFMIANNRDMFVNTESYLQFLVIIQLLIGAVLTRQLAFNDLRLSNFDIFKYSVILYFVTLILILILMPYFLMLYGIEQPISTSNALIISLVPISSFISGYKYRELLLSHRFKIIIFSSLTSFAFALSLLYNVNLSPIIAMVLLNLFIVFFLFVSSNSYKYFNRT